MAADPQQGESIGRRVRAARKLAGLTQRQLAARAHVSLGLVRQVEQGDTPASAAFTAAAARALGLRTAELTEQPYPVTTAEEHRVHSVIPALRREVVAYQLPPAEGIRPRPLPVLAAAVTHSSTLRHSAALDELGTDLPGLLAELRATTHTTIGGDRERVFGLLAETYTNAEGVANKLGYTDLGSMITERIEWAARQSGDPLALAVAEWYRAGEFIANAEWNGAQAYLDTARAHIADLHTEPALALTGMLHLKSGLAAARAGDATTSDAHLAEARAAAAHVTPGSDHYRMAFDRDNVNIWAVGLAVERNDGTEAVKRAAANTPFTTAARERVGRHHMDLARGYQLHGDRARALEALTLARKTAPLQARYHPQFRETIRTLAERDRRRSDTLASLARWAGITRI